ncbi:CooT family nickel-binding protein [Anaerosoma tenue]|jgi:predicted RNA-binding protein|uniref:CooT family nickel-binding protein n=1 Tax=Anaerosoma tenue TaxID=2933588 RepID=UPI002260F5CD|nr:CooT family nickel-binding protein [Anaerosoma tenue]MCK8115863.1 CooT family nickel-binding protein [Anaerosoma tenue]
MCEARVVIEGPDGSEVEAIDDVTTIVPEDGTLKLYDLYGGHRSVEATLKEVRLLDHVVVLSAR